MTFQNVRLGDAEFDEYADPEAYDQALDRGISISGEDKTVFRPRPGCLAGELPEVPRLSAVTGARLWLRDRDGNAVPPGLLEPRRVIGVDTSARSIETARRVARFEPGPFPDPRRVRAMR